MQKPPEFYRELGYEDGGYMPADPISDEAYPEYLKDEEKAAISLINGVKKDNSVLLGFMTDIHFAPNDKHRFYLNRTMTAYKNIAKNVGCELLLLGGDYTNEGCKEYKTAAFREFRTYFDGIKYLPAHGNHDDGSIWDKYYIEKESNYDNHIPPEEMYDLFYNHLPDIGACVPNKGLYYYYDDKKQKIRYIVVNPCDVPYTRDENGKLKYEAQHDYAIGQEQVDWLVNEALKFDEDGWGIILLSHILPFQNFTDTSRKRLLFLHYLLKAQSEGGRYVYRSTEKDFELSVNVNFASREHRAEFLFALIGHEHTDYEIKWGKLNYILRANTVAYRANPLRADGSAGQLLFDFVVVNREDRTADVIRVGCTKTYDETTKHIRIEY